MFNSQTLIATIASLVPMFAWSVSIGQVEIDSISKHAIESTTIGKIYDYDGQNNNEDCHGALAFLGEVITNDDSLYYLVATTKCLPRGFGSTEDIVIYDQNLTPIGFYSSTDLHLFDFSKVLVELDHGTLSFHDTSYSKCSKSIKLSSGFPPQIDFSCDSNPVVSLSWNEL